MGRGGRGGAATVPVPPGSICFMAERMSRLFTFVGTEREAEREEESECVCVRYERSSEFVTQSRQCVHTLSPVRSDFVFLISCTRRPQPSQKSPRPPAGPRGAGQDGAAP